MSGNLVNWDSANWKIDNMVKETRPFDEVCLLPKPRSIGFPEPRSNSDYKLLCNKLKGELTVITSNMKQEELLENLPDVDCIWSGACAGIWTGWDDERQEGSMANTYTGDILRREDGFWPFYPGETLSQTKNLYCTKFVKIGFPRFRELSGEMFTTWPKHTLWGTFQPAILGTWEKPF